MAGQDSIVFRRLKTLDERTEHAPIVLRQSPFSVSVDNGLCPASLTPSSEMDMASESLLSPSGGRGKVTSPSCLGPAVYALIAITTLVALLLAVLIVSVRRNRLVAVQYPETGFAFPATDKIASIQVHDTGSIMDFEDFDAPRHHWPWLFAALSPSQYEPIVPSMIALARLDIGTKDGRLFSIEVYWWDDSPVGAFIVDAPPPHGSKFYRGGNSKQFREAIIAAKRDAKMNSGQTRRLQQ